MLNGHRFIKKMLTGESVSSDINRAPIKDRERLSEIADSIEGIFNRKTQCPVLNIDQLARVLRGTIKDCLKILKIDQTYLKKIAKDLHNEKRFNHSIVACMAALEADPRNIKWVRECFVMFADLYKSSCEEVQHLKPLCQTQLSSVVELFFQRLLKDPNLLSSHVQQLDEFESCVICLGESWIVTSDLLSSCKGKETWVNQLAQAIINEKYGKNARASHCYKKVLKYAENSCHNSIRERLLKKRFRDRYEDTVLHCRPLVYDPDRPVPDLPNDYIPLSSNEDDKESTSSLSDNDNYGEENGDSDFTNDS